MKKKSAGNGVVIKSLGKSSGNIDPVKLRAVIRRIQADMVIDVTKRTGPIRVEDTASGSGAIRFSFGSAASVPKPRAKAKRVRAAG